MNKSALLSVFLGTFVTVTLSACSSSNEREDSIDVVTPPANFIGNEMRGRSLYAEYCSLCHGTIKKGKSAETSRGPSLISSMYKSDHHSDMHFYKAVQFGTYQHHWHFGNMPAVKDITPQQTAHIISFIRVKQSAISR